MVSHRDWRLVFRHDVFVWHDRAFLPWIAHWFGMVWLFPVCADPFLSYFVAEKGFAPALLFAFSGIRLVLSVLDNSDRCILLLCQLNEGGNNLTTTPSLNARGFYKKTVGIPRSIATRQPLPSGARPFVQRSRSYEVGRLRWAQDWILI